jgi:hypothetical protein
MRLHAPQRFVSKLSNRMSAFRIVSLSTAGQRPLQNQSCDRFRVQRKVEQLGTRQGRKGQPFWIGITQGQNDAATQAEPRAAIVSALYHLDSAWQDNSDRTPASH